MKKPGTSHRRGRGIFAVPGIQADMVVVAARRHEDCLGAIALRDLETQQFMVKCQRLVQVRHLQMHMADTCLSGYLIVHINWCSRRWFAWHRRMIEITFDTCRSDASLPNRVQQSYRSFVGAFHLFSPRQPILQIPCGSHR